jgi:hypothetical protein
MPLGDKDLVVDGSSAVFVALCNYTMSWFMAIICLSWVVYSWNDWNTGQTRMTWVSISPGWIEVSLILCLKLKYILHEPLF